VSWAQFLYPLAFLVSSDQMVLTVGIISDLIRGDTFQWGMIMAGALMAALPPLLVYAFLMDYYIAGLTACATKGCGGFQDGAGPMRFFKDVIWPLSRTNVLALFVIMFIYGWNQYLWPLLIPTRDDMTTIVIGIKKMIVTADALTEWNVVLATAMLAMLPPVLVVLLMQRWFVKGLVETEK
jgi:ABC-type glycerol-3-phosphate transport system permease component